MVRKHCRAPLLWGSEIDRQGVGILALSNTVSQNGRPGQWDKLPILSNFSMLRVRCGMRAPVQPRRADVLRALTRLFVADQLFPETTKSHQRLVHPQRHHGLFGIGQVTTLCRDHPLVLVERHE